jgi:hypothetical protein
MRRRKDFYLWIILKKKKKTTVGEVSFTSVVWCCCKIWWWISRWITVNVQASILLCTLFHTSREVWSIPRGRTGRRTWSYLKHIYDYRISLRYPKQADSSIGPIVGFPDQWWPATVGLEKPLPCGRSGPSTDMWLRVMVGVSHSGSGRRQAASASDSQAQVEWLSIWNLGTLWYHSFYYDIVTWYDSSDYYDIMAWYHRSRAES